MTPRRCFLPDPEQLGSYQMLYLTRDRNCAPFRQECLEAALKKWQALFSIVILDHRFSEEIVNLFAYVPNEPLSDEKAMERVAGFDAEQKKSAHGHWMPRAHRYKAETLNSIPAFMHDFSRDFIARHRKLAVPSALPRGTNPIPRLQGRYVAKTMQHTALPPIFTDQQLAGINARLQGLGVAIRAKIGAEEDLCLSAHGIGRRDFLEKLEQRCDEYLQDGLERPARRSPCEAKRIVPFDRHVWNRRLGELVSLDPCEVHPHVASVLLNIALLKDSMLTPEDFRTTPMDSSLSLEMQAMACRPIVIGLMLADGWLRWYYRTKKGKVFPHWNNYGIIPEWQT